MRTPDVEQGGESLFTHDLIVIGAGAGGLTAAGGRARLSLRVAGLSVPYPSRAEQLQKAVFASKDRLMFNRWTRGWARLPAWSRR